MSQALRFSDMAALAASLRAERDALKARNSKLLDTLQKSADTFDELEKFLRLTGKQITADACVIASEGCKDAIVNATTPAQHMESKS